jgi:flagellar basal body-associated protein FliL
MGRKHKLNHSFIIIIIIIVVVVVVLVVVVISCHMPFPPGTSLEPPVTPTAQASSFTLQYFPYYV